MLRGPEETPFAGGLYHGRIILPSQYPYKPPEFMFLCPTGRFEVGKKICLSISQHHPELWQPGWDIRTGLGPAGARALRGPCLLPRRASGAAQGCAGWTARRQVTFGMRAGSADGDTELHADGGQRCHCGPGLQRRRAQAPCGQVARSVHGVAPLPRVCIPTVPCPCPPVPAGLVGAQPGSSGAASSAG